MLVKVEYRNQGICHWKGPIYKFVDVAHADAFASGSVKVGTLSGYGRLESDRRDPGENSISRTFSHLDSRDPLQRVFMEAMLGVELNGDIELVGHPEGTTIHIFGIDYYCCCFSKSPDAEQFGDKQAVFEISDPHAWALRLKQQTPLLNRFIVAEVAYGERQSRLETNPAADTDPFLKPIRFITEREVRVIWVPVLPSKHLPQIPPSPPDQILAALAKRIR